MAYNWRPREWLCLGIDLHIMFSPCCNRGAVTSHATWILPLLLVAEVFKIRAAMTYVVKPFSIYLGDWIISPPIPCQHSATPETTENFSLKFKLFLSRAQSATDPYIHSCGRWQCSFPAHKQTQSYVVSRKGQHGHCSWSIDMHQEDQESITFPSQYLKYPWEQWVCTIMLQASTLKTTVFPTIDSSVVINVAFSNTWGISTKLRPWPHNMLQQLSRTDSSTKLSTFSAGKAYA